MTDLRAEVVEALGPDVDILVGSVLQLRPDDIKSEEDRIRQMTKDLKAKREKEAEHLQRVEEIDGYLSKIHRLVEIRPKNTVAYLLSTVLTVEKTYHQDQANRQHVNQQEVRLEEAKQRLRTLKVKHALVESLVGGQR